MENNILDQSSISRSQLEYASFWVRFLAITIDGLLLGTINYAFASIFGVDQNQFGPYQGFTILLYWLYFAYFESSDKQATLGKQAMSIKVTDLNGERISFAQATGRHFSKILSVLIIFIGYIMAAFTEKKQALHDMIVGTLVVKN